MSEPKTKKNDASVEEFLNSVENDQKREDSFALLKMMEEVTGHPPKMWGASIVGFGTYQYKYASGREGEWMTVGFSPRKTSLTLYILSGFEGQEDLLANLGKFKTGKSCLYIKKLTDVDNDVLRDLVDKSAKHMIETNS